MAYQTGSSTGQTDLMSKVSTFAQANGYTLDYYNGTTNRLSLRRAVDNLFVSFVWDDTNTIAMYQALGWTSDNQESPWLHADDSGNGSNTVPSQIDRGRQVSRIGPGSYTAYHFFAYDSPTYAIHIVLEFSPGLYRHFGFGKLEKEATWTGGAWVAGHLWHWAGSTPFNVYGKPAHAAHTVLLDGILRHGMSYYFTNNNNSGATIHCEGLPGQDSSSKWGTCIHQDNTVYDDRGGNPRVRICGGFRAGVGIAQFGHVLPNLANGFMPIIPIEVIYMRDWGGAGGWYYMGRCPNVGHIHLHGIDAAQELIVGSDTWIAFPMVRKSNVGSPNQESENAGIIYKKVT